MGYYGNGFVFVREPDWHAFEKLPQALGLTGYAHRDQNLFLLDVWTCTGWPHWHFTDEIVEKDIALPEPAPLTQSVLDTFNQICEIVRQAEFTEATYGESALRLLAFLSERSGDEVFYFAGDDELTDMAAVAKQGLFVRFQVHFGVYVVAYVEDGFTVTPQEFAESPEITVSKEVLARLGQLPRVMVAPPVSVDRGRALYSAALQLWPAAAGDPVEMLGVGTWDPFEHVERDYTETLSRPCAVTVKPRAEDPAQTLRLDHEFAWGRPFRKVLRVLAAIFGAGVLLLILASFVAYLIERLR